MGCGGCSKAHADGPQCMGAHAGMLCIAACTISAENMVPRAGLLATCVAMLRPTDVPASCTISSARVVACAGQLALCMAMLTHRCHSLSCGGVDAGRVALHGATMTLRCCTRAGGRLAGARCASLNAMLLLPLLTWTLVAFKHARLCLSCMILTAAMAPASCAATQACAAQALQEALLATTAADAADHIHGSSGPCMPLA